MYDAISMGEFMVAFEAQSFGPLREAEDFKKWVGGAADNFIITLARLGFNCGWFSRVGDDEFGRFITRWIRGEGVDVSRVKVDSSRPTGVFFVERRSPESKFECHFYRSTSTSAVPTPGTALILRGMPSPSARLPFTPVPPETVQRVKAALQELGLL